MTDLVLGGATVDLTDLSKGRDFSLILGLYGGHIGVIFPQPSLDFTKNCVCNRTPQQA